MMTPVKKITTHVAISNSVTDGVDISTVEVNQRERQTLMTMTNEC